MNSSTHMRILYIIHEATRSGAPMQMLRIIRNLKEQHGELQQDILLMFGGNTLQEEFRQSADQFFILDTYSSSLRTKIKQYLSHRNFLRQQYDLIVANTVVALAPGIRYKKHFSAPLVFCLRESEYSFRIYDGFERDISYCDKIITVSNLVKSVLVQKYKIASSHIEVIHNFPAFKLEDGTTGTNLPPEASGKFIIGLSGELAWRKGCDILPLLATAYKRKYPSDNILFLWLGNYSKGVRHQMEYDTDTSSTSDIIYMAGLVKNPIPYYHSFDIFLILSREESFGNVVSEAALIGKPIVGFDDCVGAIELMKQGNACIAVPYLDIDAMSDALHDLYIHPDKRHDIGQKGKEWLSSQLDDQRSTDQYYRILIEISQNKRS